MITVLCRWLVASRPQTLVVAIVPVAVGLALAATRTDLRWDLATACLAAAVLVQVAINYANDAGDALRGADGPHQSGPPSAVARGWISPRAMLVAAACLCLVFLAIATWLATIAGWWILPLAAISAINVFIYTSGPHPLAYHGLGEVFVFLFFGLAATMATARILVTAGAGATTTMPWWWWAVAAAVGIQATAILVVNNIRDRVTDQVVDKRTLVVRFGDRFGRIWLLLLHLTATAALTVAALAAARLLMLIPAVMAGIGGTAVALASWRVHGPALHGWLGRCAGLELITGTVLVITLVW